MLTECDESEFQEICKKNYENYVETTKLVPIEMLKKINSKTKEYENIIKTMKSWCEDKRSPCAKGFVFQSSSITDICMNLYYGKISTTEERRDYLGMEFDIEEFPSKDTIVVYNPVERVILLIREANDEDVQSELKLCGVELKMLMMLLKNELKESGIKVIPLVVTEKEVKCKPCTNHLISKKEIENIELFIKWWERKSVYYDITIRDSLDSKNMSGSDQIDEDRAKEILRKFVSCMSLRKIEDIFPTQKVVDQMKGALLLLTPEQIDILCSEDKHMIIDGPYGSGKSIVARIKAKMLEENLPENESLYYISHDSKSALSHEIPRQSSKMQIYPSKEKQKRKKLSSMIIDILKINGQCGEKKDIINLIIDEYDSEKLDEKEATKIKEIIYDKYSEVFNDAAIILVPQSMKKERKMNNLLIDCNRFDILGERMKRKKLTLVMRNSVKIFNLLQATQEFLKGVKTIYKLPEEQNDDPENDHVPRKKSIAHEEPGKPPATTMLDNAGASSTENGGVPKSPRNSSFEYDEAIAYSQLPPAVKADDGSKLESNLPKLFQLHSYEDEFQKILTLAVIFEALNIAKSNANDKHVVLHFKKDNEIPRKTFQLRDHKLRGEQRYTEVNSKIAYAYEEFKDDTTAKYIFVGNFRTFRGLEHSKITLIIDSDISALRHYLVECIARCTTELNIVSLGSNKDLINLTSKWKEQKNEPLVRQWYIEIVEEKRTRKELFETRREGIIKIFKSSKCYEEMNRFLKEKIPKKEDDLDDLDAVQILRR